MPARRAPEAPRIPSHRSRAPAATTTATDGRRRRVLTGGAGSIGAALLGGGALAGRVAHAQAPRSPAPSATSVAIGARPVVRGLEHPWAIAFLPDGRLLVTERGGRMRLVADGRPGPALRGVPSVLARGQGGLLDVVLSPTFDKDALIFFTFSETGAGGAATAVARARLADDRLADVDVIWRQAPKVEGSNHYGSRIVFRTDGTMWVALGDRYGAKDLAQKLDNTIGKVIRIRPDGSAPPDNPFVGRDGALPEIWSYGHRNLQGATRDPVDGSLWTVMHGARGGDELDRPEAGRNYGWPEITYGTDYGGQKIGSGTARAGMEQPIYYWDPVIAPSGLTFCTGERYPDFNGDLIIGALRGGIVRLRLKDRKVVRELRHLPDVGRVRDVRQGPDGLLYLAIDSSDGAILRLDPRS